jgi:hypothetical protein
MKVFALFLSRLLADPDYRGLDRLSVVISPAALTPARPISLSGLRVIQDLAMPTG